MAVLGYHFWASRFAADPAVIGATLFVDDSRLVVFTLGVSVLATMLFGLAPAIRAGRHDLLRVLEHRAGSRSAGSSWMFARGLLVAQVAACVLLLVAGTLLVRTLINLRAQDPGFVADNLLLISIGPDESRYEGARVASFYQSIVSRAEALPGVLSAGLAASPVFGPNLWNRSIWVEAGSAGESPMTGFNVVAPGFFATAGVQLVLGRDFSSTDRPDTPRAVIVNETLQVDTARSAIRSAADSVTKGLVRRKVLRHRRYQRRKIP